jgi:hypothetical protein
VNRVDSEKNYFLKKCAAHPVYENFRVNNFKGLLQNLSEQNDKQGILKKNGRINAAKSSKL